MSQAQQSISRRGLFGWAAGAWAWVSSPRLGAIATGRESPALGMPLLSWTPVDSVRSGWPKIIAGMFDGKINENAKHIEESVRKAWKFSTDAGYTKQCCVDAMLKLIFDAFDEEKANYKRSKWSLVFGTEDDRRVELEIRAVLSAIDCAIARGMSDSTMNVKISHR